MLENRFPRIWVPDAENRDVRQLLWHRCRLVQMRTRVMNQLHVVPLNEGLRRKKAFGGSRHRDRTPASRNSSEDKALTNRFLRSRVSVESIRKQIEAHTVIREKVSTSVDLPLSNESKRVLAYALEEAERLTNQHIGTEHLLLGLLREEKCFAAQILMERELRLIQIQEDLRRKSHEPTHVPRRPSVPDELGRCLADLVVQAWPLIGRQHELDRLIELRTSPL